MDESDLTEIALKLADGTPVDWDALKTDAPEAHARLLNRLQQIEALARLSAAALPERDQLDSIRKALYVDENAPLRWGHLEILEKIGRGSYGDVYKARDARLDRIVALKLLRGRTEGAQSDSEIIDEARLLARVRHSNVVTVYGAERIDGRAGVWMEYIDGRTLEEELAARGPFTAQDICDVGKALCGALTAVHEAGLFHRDIKAQNVMRDARGRVVLTDFGAGRDYLRLVDSSNEEMAGTPAYLAPETWRGAAVSPGTEVYGLGVLLFRLATASFPVRGRTLGEIKDAHDRNVRTTCRDARTALPPSLIRIIDRAIDPDPARRYQSAEALESALRTVSSSSRVRKAALAAVAVALLASLAVVVHRVVSKEPNVDAPSLSSKNSVGGEIPANAPSAISVPVAGTHGPAPQIIGGLNPSLLSAKSSAERQMSRDALLGDSLSVGNPGPDGTWLVCLYRFTFDLSLARCHVDRPASHVPATLGPRLNDAQWEGGVIVSPDGRQAAYLTRTSPPELRTAPMNSPQSTLVHRFNPMDEICPLALWSWEADTLAGCVSNPSDATGTPRIANHQIVLISQTTGMRTWQLGRRRPGRVSLAPDGRYLAYEAFGDDNRTDRDVFLVDLAAGSERPIANTSANEIAPVWHSATTLAYLHKQDDRWSTSERNVQSGVLTSSFAPQFDGANNVSVLGHRNGKTFYVTKGADSTSSFAPLSWSGQRLTKVGEPSSIPGIGLTSSGRAWSRDGRLIASFPDGISDGVSIISNPDRNVWSQKVDERLANVSSRRIATWSWDGTQLVVCCAQEMATTTAWRIGFAKPQSNTKIEEIDIPAADYSTLDEVCPSDIPPTYGWRGYDAINSIAVGSSDVLYFSTGKGIWRYITRTGRGEKLYSTDLQREMVGGGLSLSPDQRSIAFKTQTCLRQSESGPFQQPESVVRILQLDTHTQFALWGRQGRIDNLTWLAKPDEAMVFVIRDPESPFPQLVSVPLRSGSSASEVSLPLTMLNVDVAVDGTRIMYARRGERHLWVRREQ